MIKKFLLTQPLNQVTLSRALYEVWTYYGEQTQKDDCEHLIKALELAVKQENLEKDREKLLKSLNDKDQVQTL